MRISMACTLALLGGCAEDLSDALADDDDGGDDGGAQIEHVDEDGVVRTIVDATASDGWVYLDLESRSQVAITDPQASDRWDLGFQRFNIAIDGGVSGPGGMEGVVLEGATLAEIEAAPSGPWITDALDGDDHGDEPDYVLAGWYDYDFVTHVLSPKAIVYVLRSVEGNAFAIEVVEYYDDAGVSGWLQVRWKPIDG
jgi:hypothetical protein